MNNLSATTLNNAKNIGATIQQRLNNIGIFTLGDLAEITPVIAYQKMKAEQPNQTLPQCYYLYSLQGALMDVQWEELPEGLKDELKRQVRHLS